MDDCTLNEGSSVTYAITVTNHGSSDATGRWAVGNLNNGESKTLHITVTVIVFDYQVR